MNFLIEAIVLVLIVAVIYYVSKMDRSTRYEYVEVEDEDGNIIEKVIDHKDKE
jgi:uncharacterized protein (UPF0333 family)